MSCNSTCNTVSIDDKTVNGTYRFLYDIQKDGVTWTGIDSATIIFIKPDKTEFTKTMTVLDDSQGLWYYDTVIGDLDVAGYWAVTIQVIDDTINVRFANPNEFLVV